jgi:hypothetical protein
LKINSLVLDRFFFCFIFGIIYGDVLKQVSKNRWKAALIQTLLKYKIFFFFVFALFAGECVGKNVGCISWLWNRGFVGWSCSLLEYTTSQGISR